MSKKVRSSNFEALRMLAMIMVIALHQNGTVNAMTVLTPGDTNYYLSHVFESLCICAVDCFILISGYFMIRKKEARLKQCIKLLVDVAFWGLLAGMLGYIVWGNRIGIKDVVVLIIPYFKGQRWFVRDYIILMLLAPFLNVCLTRLSKRDYRILLTVMILLLSVWPSFLPNPPLDNYGYSFVHFVLLYVIAGYLHLHEKKNPKRTICICSFLMSTTLIFISSVMGWGYAYAYNYLFVITAALSLFMLFRGMQFQSVIINNLAACAFDIFVIHTTGFFSQLIYIKMFHSDTVLFRSKGEFIVTWIVCPLIFYLFGAVLTKVKNWFFKNTINKCIDKLPIKNYCIE